MDTELRYLHGFTLHRADVAEGLMEPLPIVEYLDELKYCCPGLVAGRSALSGSASHLM